MNLADQYAKALFDVSAKNPHNFSAYLKNLNEALKRRGHQRLLPSIVQSYEKLEANRDRQKRLRTVTPEMKRTRVLVELYRKLTA